MANFIIPKGEDYTFKVTILDTDSFLPMDLSGVTSLVATFKLIDPATSTEVFSVTGTAVDLLNGVMSFSLTATTHTGSLDNTNRGSEADWYYLRPKYQGSIKVTGAEIPDVFTVIEKIYVI